MSAGVSSNLARVYFASSPGSITQPFLWHCQPSKALAGDFDLQRCLHRIEMDAEGGIHRIRAVIAFHAADDDVVAGIFEIGVEGRWARRCLVLFRFGCGFNNSGADCVLFHTHVHVHAPERHGPVVRFSSRAFLDVWSDGSWMRFWAVRECVSRVAVGVDTVTV